MGITKARIREIARALKVTDHGDYRVFLALVYAQAKALDPAFSYARYSEILGLGSSNAHSVIAGRRTLTAATCDKVCEALGLVGVQKRYFRTFVDQERATTLGESETAFARRLELRQRVLPTELDRRRLAFFEHWYHAAILEVLRLPHASDDAGWLSESIRPEVPKSRVTESLALLRDLGYLAWSEERRRLFPTDVTITTGNEAEGLAVASYHRQMLGLSIQAIEAVPDGERDVSALTLTVSPALRDQMKAEIATLRKRFLALAAQEESPGEVVQINVQMFPLSMRKRK